MMRLLTNFAMRLDRAMRPPAPSGGNCTSRVGCSSLYRAGLDVRPGKLSWLIARAVTLQYR